MGRHVELPHLSPKTIENKNNAIERGARFLAYKIVMPLLILGGPATVVFTDADTTGYAMCLTGVGIPILHGLAKLRNRYGHQMAKHYPDDYKQI